MKHLLFLAIFSLSSCTTVDYWYNHLFVMPKNPFPENKIQDGWIEHNPATDPQGPETRKRIMVRFRDGFEIDTYAMHVGWCLIPGDEQLEIVAWKEL